MPVISPTRSWKCARSGNAPSSWSARTKDCAARSTATCSGKRRSSTRTAEFTYKDAPLFSEARAVSKFAQNLFLKGEVDAVDILFTNFISTLTQKPEVRSLLPVGEIKAVRAELEEGTPESAQLLKGATEFLFEPNAEQVLGSLLPHYLSFLTYQILLEAK